MAVTNPVPHGLLQCAEFIETERQTLLTIADTDMQNVSKQIAKGITKVMLSPQANFAVKYNNYLTQFAKGAIKGIDMYDDMQSDIQRLQDSLKRMLHTIDQFIGPSAFKTQVTTHIINMRVALSNISMTAKHKKENQINN